MRSREPIRGHLNGQQTLIAESKVIQMSCNCMTQCKLSAAKDDRVRRGMPPEQILKLCSPDPSVTPCIHCSIVGISDQQYPLVSCMEMGLMLLR